MAEVAVPGHYHTRHSSGIAPMAAPAGPIIEMMPNPDFSFPVRPRNPPRRDSEEESKRPASMHVNMPPPQMKPAPHRRTASTLPSFTFNAEDASGLKEADKTPPTTPDENAPVTPSRRGHRRGGSEFVGGDSRLGVSNTISSSPTKTSALPLPLPEPATGPPPSHRRGHAHRRSAAISSHDASIIMQPTELMPRLSTSLPTTPMEQPSDAPPVLERSFSSPTTDGDLSDPFGPPLDTLPARPPSRPRVEFAEDVEIIPRPLSTISSETEGSISTHRGHSVNNSISSMLSMGTSSPQSPRGFPPTLSMMPEDDYTPRAKSSLEISKRVEKEGEWLKSRPSANLKRPLSESAVESPKTTFVEPELPTRSRDMHKKKHSLSHALGFDRRRSEPAIGLSANEPSRLSTISLQEPAKSTQTHADEQEARTYEHRSSTQKIKDWAVSKLGRKSKEAGRGLTSSGSASSSSIRPDSAGSVSVPGRVPVAESPVAETNLDAVFHSEDDAGAQQNPTASSQPRTELSMPISSLHRRVESNDSEDFMVDLDAAVGPLKTPSFGSQRQRRGLHSSRLTKDFGGPGMHYHRRAESAPALSPFEGARTGTPSQSSMADVFEEDEEEDARDETGGDTSALRSIRPTSAQSGQDDESKIGIQVVDSENTARGSALNWGIEEGLGIQQGDWEPERPTTSYGNNVSRLSTSGPRASSIVSETIVEERGGSGETLQIVDADEEPRASSLTKSSDSSETPTILAPSTGLLALPDAQQSWMTPDTYQTSAFSSPDIGRRQGSFDTSRLGTAASSITDNQTLSSCDHGGQLRVSVDDVPSLTSSRSTMISTAHGNGSTREVAGSRTPSGSSGIPDSTVSAERQKKRGSIQSLSQLMGGSFGTKLKGQHEARPQTAADPVASKVPKKKEHRLKKLMFWRSKQHSKQTQQS